jgi:hemoglobin-like flavoprotein
MDTQRSRQLRAIVATIQNLDDHERLDGYLCALGRDHRKFHVTAQHYPRAKAALLDVLRNHTGDR